MYVHGWIDRTYDCYVMYSRCRNGLFSRIGHEDGLDVGLESDEEALGMNEEAES